MSLLTVIVICLIVLTFAGGLGYRDGAYRGPGIGLAVALCLILLLLYVL